MLEAVYRALEALAATLSPGIFAESSIACRNDCLSAQAAESPCPGWHTARKRVLCNLTGALENDQYFEWWCEGSDGDGVVMVMMMVTTSTTTTHRFMLCRDLGVGRA